MTDNGPLSGEPICIAVDGFALSCRPGESIAAAMLAAGIRRFRTDSAGRPRGLFCGMGSCGECTVTVGDRQVRACLTPVADGMTVSTHG
jgi:sarcosine oxidase subunit alpha